jgi:hypothetical protein
LRSFNPTPVWEKQSKVCGDADATVEVLLCRSSSGTTSGGDIRFQIYKLWKWKVGVAEEREKKKSDYSLLFEELAE